jgi:hypothetical protein
LQWPLLYIAVTKIYYKSQPQYAGYRVHQQSLLVCRLFHNEVPIDDNLRARDCNMVLMCSTCHKHDKSSKHLSFDCDFSIQYFHICVAHGTSFNRGFWNVSPREVLEHNKLAAVFQLTLTPSNLCLFLQYHMIVITLIMIATTVTLHCSDQYLL